LRIEHLITTLCTVPLHIPNMTASFGKPWDRALCGESLELYYCGTCL